MIQAQGRQAHVCKPVCDHIPGAGFQAQVETMLDHAVKQVIDFILIRILIRILILCFFQLPV